MIDSAYKKENIDKLLEWLKAESVLTQDGQKIPNTGLTKLHKYTIVRKVYADSHYTQDFKDDLLKTVIGDAKDDQAKNLKLACQSLNPTPEGKEKSWLDITNFKAGYSSYEWNTLWANFFSRKSLDITKPYFPKLIQKIREVADCGDKEYIEAFIDNLIPTYGID